MSLTRQFLREFRPLFRMLEEPFGVSPRYARPNSFFDDPFFHSPRALRPAVDVTEEGNKYVVEAELPGVKKEDIEVRISDGGRSVTIEGKIAERIRIAWTAHLVWTRSEELPGVGLFARRVVESWQRREDASIWASCLVKLDV